MQNKQVKQPCEPLYAFGITSQCQDLNHVYMADIDENIKLENVIDIVHDISKCYMLGKIFIIKSTNGYNIISLDKISLKLIYLINQIYPSIDQVYNDLQYYKRGFYTLRIDTDKKLVYQYDSGKNIYVFSNAHRRFLNSQFNINIPATESFDAYDVLRVIKFKNKKHGVVSS